MANGFFALLAVLLDQADLLHHPRTEHVLLVGEDDADHVVLRLLAAPGDRPG
ncbi:hypothetical protein D3C84_1310310 [compost metagenome]